MLKHTPNGYAEVIKTFGDLKSPLWAEKNLVTLVLSYPLICGDKRIIHIVCHKLVADNFIQVFTQIEAAGLQDQAKNFGGIYNQRNIRGQIHPSLHSWAIAIDLEPDKYPLGSNKRFPDSIIKIFHDAGFFYGGDFKNRKDPMHWQFATGC